MSDIGNVLGNGPSGGAIGKSVNGGEGAWYGSVSYTHLTLPTNREV